VTVLEKCTNPVIEKVRKYLQQKGTDEEIVATINETDNPVEQNLLETETPMHRVQASYDMGWQVYSSGNKYGSPTRPCAPMKQSRVRKGLAGHLKYCYGAAVK